MKWILALGIYLLSSLGMAEQVNVYLIYDDTRLRQKIAHFNQYLDKHGIFEKYNVRPFLEKYPLHTTLYLTNYKPEQLFHVMESLQTQSQKWSQFNIKTGAIHMTKGNYLMMDVEHKPEEDGLNPIMQEYSDATVMSLYKMRDTTAPIPDWAKNIPSKYAAYVRYGSPNVFFELSPHFTLMARQFDDPQVEVAFQAEMETLSMQYEQKFPSKPITVRATHIGIGYVNAYGQITQELSRFPLQ